MTAGMVATLARGGPAAEALRTGAACGALNVVRRGLGTGNADAVAAIAERVELVAVTTRPGAVLRDVPAGGPLGLSSASSRRMPTFMVTW